MNPDNNHPTPPEKPVNEANAKIDLDDDLENEPLGERQGDCDSDEACEVCQ